MRDLMRHYAGHFGLGIGAQDQPAVNVEESAWQSEGIHHIGIDHLYGEGHLGVGVAHQVLPHTIDILTHHWIINQLGRALNLLRQGLAERDFPFD